MAWDRSASALTLGSPTALSSRSRLYIGASIYAAAAFVDMSKTLAGMGADLWMEGNPLMRTTMLWLGPEVGLLAHKAAGNGNLAWGFVTPLKRAVPPASAIIRSASSLSSAVVTPGRVISRTICWIR